MSHRQNNNVLVGVGVRVLRRDEGVERAMVFHHIFVMSEGLLAIIAASQIKTKGGTVSTLCRCSNGSIFVHFWELRRSPEVGVSLFLQ